MWVFVTVMRRALTLVLTLLFAVRCLLPAGVMLSETATAGGKTLAVTLCPGHAKATPAADQSKRSSGPEAPSNKSGKGQTSCPYAAATLAADTLSHSAEVSVAIIYIAVDYALPYFKSSVAHLDNGHSARGPPSRLI